MTHDTGAYVIQWTVKSIHSDGSISRASGYETAGAARKQAAHLFLVSDAQQITLIREIVTSAVGEGDA